MCYVNGFVDNVGSLPKDADGRPFDPQIVAMFRWYKRFPFRLGLQNGAEQSAWEKGMPKGYVVSLRE